MTLTESTFWVPGELYHDNHGNTNTTIDPLAIWLGSDSAAKSTGLEADTVHILPPQSTTTANKLIHTRTCVVNL